MRIHNYPHLVRVGSDKVKLLNFALANGLIKRTQYCVRRYCRRKMTIISDKSTADGFRFRCTRCRSTKSLRKSSFFEQSKLTLAQILYITYCWAAKVSVMSAVYMSGVCRNSISQWYQYLRELCSKELIECTDYFLGGPGVVVQIDDSLVAKRKYNDGRIVEQRWIFGIYDTEKKVGHIQLVNDRTADTLIPIVQNNVHPGSTIYSDKSSAYRQLEDLGFQHVTVNHSENFISPTTGTCTNAIKAYWSRVKRSIRLHWLSRRDQLPLRIDEFLWRDRLSSKTYNDVFHEMIRLMANY